MDILRFFEISLARHAILNPFTPEKFALLGDVFRVGPEDRVLDLCCGKGEMLCTWADRHGCSGVGVDISEIFLEAARARGSELDVGERVAFVRGEAAQYARESRETFSRVTCIGATWIGGGLAGTLELMRPRLEPEGGLLAVGEPFWIDEPPEEAYEPVAGGREVFTSLAGTHERIEAAGFELVEMVAADTDSWDRYEAPQWTTVADWLREHPNDPDAADFAEYDRKNRDAYLRYGRRYLGWGVFVLAPR